MDKKFLLLAIEKSKESVEKGGFPAGAIIVKDGKVIGEGICIGNIVNDPTSHGESVAIRMACKKLQTTNLEGSVLYASMQPCLMCLGAAMWSSVSKIVYGCSMENVDEGYYGGKYDSKEINKSFTHSIEMIYMPELENEVLDIVKNWEKSNF